MKRSPMKRRGKRTKKSKGHLFPKLVDDTYRDYIRVQPCLVPIGPHEGRVQVCHVRSRGAGGPDYGNAIPMCMRHHAQQHAMGIKTFQNFYNLDLAVHAKWYYLRYEADYLTPFRDL